MAKERTLRWGRRSRNNAPLERGVTMIETMIAVAILLIVVVGVLPVFTAGFQVTEQQGDISTRTSEYAQDKMESLLKLDFLDSTTDTTKFPPVAGGTGLGGAMAASTTVGAVPPAAAVANYVDYYAYDGTYQNGTAAGAYYTRQWSITTDATGTLKTITVAVTSVQKAGVLGLAPSTTLVCIKSNNL
jgi:prepilin-type N-terminal cleavage/methylation domain-containing protein